MPSAADWICQGEQLMKNRVRTVVVLVCVFVVLPVVGGLVYSFSVSAEAAARYYAEAVARAALRTRWRLRAPMRTLAAAWGVATPSTCAVAACRRLAQR